MTKKIVSYRKKPPTLKTVEVGLTEDPAVAVFAVNFSEDTPVVWRALQPAKPAPTNQTIIASELTCFPTCNHSR